MGIPADFPGANKVYRAPDGREDVGDLAVFFNGSAIVSAWKLDPAELAEVNRTGTVFLSVLSGGVLFPVAVGSEESIRLMVADYGQVWQRSAQPAPVQSAPALDMGGLVESLFHEVTSVSDTADEAFAVVRCVIDLIAAYYTARAVG